MSQAELITAGAKSPPPTNTPARVGVSLRRAIRPRERHIVASKDGAVTGYWDVPKELVSARSDGGAIEEQGIFGAATIGFVCSRPHGYENESREGAGSTVILDSRAVSLTLSMYAGSHD